MFCMHTVEVVSANTPVPNLLDQKGMLKLLSAKEYDTIPHDSLRMFCHNFARYGLPTIELTDWLKEKIADRKAIEIGSGSGDLALHLDIPATDNHMQEWKIMRDYYRTIGQPTIKYPAFVQTLDALVAVERLKPEVVVASWVTEWIDPDKPMPPQGGNMFGVKETEILASGVTYILIGNHNVHGHKAIMAQPHEEFNLPFVRSRSAYPELNRVWIWNH
jgi:hypothetical protein